MTIKKNYLSLKFTALIIAFSLVTFTCMCSCGSSDSNYDETPVEDVEEPADYENAEAPQSEGQVTYDNSETNEDEFDESETEGYDNND